MGNIPTQAEYEKEEARRHAALLAEIERAPLAERKAAREAWRQAMADYPAIVGERVGWLLNGSYGFWACRVAARVVAEKRGNKAAMLGQLIAALEWLCPADYARQAWCGLSKPEQSAVNQAIQSAIDETEPAVTV